MDGKPVFDVAVVGGGPAGLAAALAVNATGSSLAVVAPPHRPPVKGPESRTAALFAGSITCLENLGVWDDIAAHAAPITAIRLIDDMDGWLKAPEVVFSAADAGIARFGFNVPNARLVEALELRLARAVPAPALHRSQSLVRAVPGADAIRLELSDGHSISARLAAAADGRASPCRQGAGIATRAWSYPQAALVCTFEHARPHECVSSEFHKPQGPVTTVPLPGEASSLVWVTAPEEAARLAGLDDAGFRDALGRQLKGLLGGIGAVTPRFVFPLSGLSAERFADRRVALIGEAGHVIPPIGAQGLNLGLRDAAEIADCVGRARARSDDPGGPAVMDDYARRRGADVNGRILSVDLLNRSLLLSHILPVHLLRGAGLHVLKNLKPLRRLLIEEGLGPSYARPSLMQADGARTLARLSAPATESAEGGRRTEAAPA